MKKLLSKLLLIAYKKLNGTDLVTQEEPKSERYIAALSQANYTRKPKITHDNNNN